MLNLSHVVVQHVAHSELHDTILILGLLELLASLLENFVEFNKPVVYYGMNFEFHP